VRELVVILAILIKLKEPYIPGKDAPSVYIKISISFSITKLVS
jgi:hypothetical protein